MKASDIWPAPSFTAPCVDLPTAALLVQEAKAAAADDEWPAQLYFSDKKRPKNEVEGLRFLVSCQWLGWSSPGDHSGNRGRDILRVVRGSFVARGYLKGL